MHIHDHEHQILGEILIFIRKLQPRVPDAMLEADRPGLFPGSLSSIVVGSRGSHGPFPPKSFELTRFPNNHKPDSSTAIHPPFVRSCNQLDNTTGLLDLLLRQLADPSRADDQGDFGQAALAEDLRVAEGQEVEDRGGVLLRAGDVGVAGLGGDEGPQLADTVRTGLVSRLPIGGPWHHIGLDHARWKRRGGNVYVPCPG